MTDHDELLARLRIAAEDCGLGRTSVDHSALMDEAADEIELLRAALKAVINPVISYEEANAIIRTALASVDGRRMAETACGLGSEGPTSAVPAAEQADAPAPSSESPHA